MPIRYPFFGSPPSDHPHTRLTNGFSKKLLIMPMRWRCISCYNFVRIHKTLRTTPAMAANVIKRLWEIGRVSCASSIGTLFPELGPASCRLIGEWWIEV